MAGHHLAQINIGRLRGPLDSPEVAGFVAELEPINALADAAQGFVWRLQTDEGDATSIRPFDDDTILVNMSVWASLETLRDFVYRSDHRKVLAQRRQWFERMDEVIFALWWVPAGHRPTLTEAKARLEALGRLGPTPEAFTFRSPFPAPGAPPGSERQLDGPADLAQAAGTPPDPLHGRHLVPIVLRPAHPGRMEA